MPRSRYSKSARKPGVHWAAVATSWLNAQSLVLDIISSRADRVRDYSSGGGWLSRPVEVRRPQGGQLLQDAGKVRGPTADRDDRPGNMRGPVGREARHAIGALPGRTDRRSWGALLTPLD